MASKSMIVVHHAGKRGENSTYRSIFRNHVVKKGWSAVAYHIVIEKNGASFRGRGDWVTGAHTLGRDSEDNLLFNKKALGVCLCGNFDRQEVRSEQWTSLVQIVASWCKKFAIFPDETTIVGHRDLQSTKRKKNGVIFENSCPGERLYSQLANLRSQVAAEIQRQSVLDQLADIDSGEVKGGSDVGVKFIEDIHHQGEEKWQDRHFMPFGDTTPDS